MRVTATRSQEPFGSLCAQAKREPVFVEKAGQIDTVILRPSNTRPCRPSTTRPRRGAQEGVRSRIRRLDRRPERPLRNARHSWCRLAPVVVQSMAQYDVYTNPSSSAA